VKTSDFDYHLPPESIAQTPIEPRHNARLLVIDRSRAGLEHRIFHQLGEKLQPGDLLVINQTRVIPARIFARKPTGGRVELLLLNQRDEQTWEALVGGKRVSSGLRLQLEEGPAVEIVENLEGSRRLVRFDEAIAPYLASKGQMPLPPYIHTPLQNPERYQTVYATQSGSAAAPTAGLHFTPELMHSLQAAGVRFATVTLHVGLDTFAPVIEDDPDRT
jgi:S-adenosylmethionine:tRNA ribosyltransferase-isomerase